MDPGLQDLATTRSVVRPHDHAICLFDEEADLLEPLGQFLREGLRQEETTVYVHSFGSDVQAWAFLEHAYPGVQRLRDDQVVLVSLYTDAFEGGRGRIDTDHVKEVLVSLQEQAKRRGKKGLRIFVDASRMYLSERSAEWFAFESWLGPRLHEEVALVCAYPQAGAMKPEHLSQILRTHSYRYVPERPADH